MFLFTVGFLLVGAVGYVILVLSRNASLSYFAIYLSAAGIFPLIPNTIAILSGNTEGSYKRAVTVGIAISWGNLNGAVASNIYRADQRVRLSLSALCPRFASFEFSLSITFDSHFAETRLILSSRSLGTLSDMVLSSPTSESDWSQTRSTTSSVRSLCPVPIRVHC